MKCLFFSTITAITFTVSQDSEEEKIKKVDTLVDDYGYNFVQENQLAKMTAAAYNSRVSAKWDNDTLYLSGGGKK